MKPFTTIAAVLVLIGMTAAAHAQQPQQQPQQPQSYVVAGAPRPIYPAPLRAALGGCSPRGPTTSRSIWRRPPPRCG